MPRKFLHVVNGNDGYEQHPVTKINIALSKSAGQKTFHITPVDLPRPKVFIRQCWSTSTIC
jgi:hypothetical protein